jgi:hypothetical protein
MKYQRRPARKPAVPEPPAPAVHPARAPRSTTGAKGGAWAVALPMGQPAPRTAVLALDTGVDSATVVVGDAHGDAPRFHPVHDLAVVVTSGSGELRWGDAAETLSGVRYAAPCTLVIPAGTWHQVLPDPGSAPLTAVFTRPGATVDRFSVVDLRAEPGLVHLDTLPIAAWAMVPARVVDVTSSGGERRDAAPRAPTSGDTLPAIVGERSAGAVPVAPGRPARVVPYEQPVDGEVLVLDTGSDTLLVGASRGRSWDRAPVDVPVHRHDLEDELVVLDAGEGWLLSGRTPDSVTRTAWRAPCVLVMPAGSFHQVVRTDDAVANVIVVHTHRNAVTASWDGIAGEMRIAARGSPPGDRRA